MSLATIAGAIRERTEPEKPADISAVMARINALLDHSIAADGFASEGASRVSPTAER